MSYKDQAPKSKDGRANFVKSGTSFNSKRDMKSYKSLKSTEKPQPSTVTYDSEHPYTISKGRPKSGKSGKDVFDIVSNAIPTHSKTGSGEDLDNVKFASVDPGQGQQVEEIAEDLVQQMEAKAKKHSDNQRYHQAFEIIVKVIDHKQRSQTEHPEEILEYAIKMCKIFNQFGMSLLNTQKYIESQRLFDKIIKSLKKFHGDQVDQLIGLTLNNLSCSYKRNGQILEAQQALNKAFKYQSKKGNARSEESPDQQSLEETFGAGQQNQKDELALTELNMCAILSHKGDHNGALKHVKSSIEKLENDIAALKAKLEQGSADAELVEEAKEKQSLLAIAYYNQGCQQEHLKEYSKSLQSYQVALNLEKSKLKIKLNGDTSPLPPARTTPILQEFTKSYNEMRKKVAAQKAYSVGFSQAAFSEGKRTFSNLTKQHVDQHSSAVSGRPSSPRGQRAGRRNHAYLATGNSNVPSRLSPRKELSQQRKGSTSGENLRRRRPMSAKNPDLVPKFNARNEQSTPQLIGDDIINIQQHVIDEEEPIEDAAENEALSRRPQTLQTAKVEQPRSKARKIRPVSSYVKNLGGEQRHSGLLGQPQLPQKKRALQDQMHLGGTTSYNYSSKQNQMLNEPSDRFSNMDSFSNVGLKKPSQLSQPKSQLHFQRRLAQQRKLKQQSRAPIVVSHNMVNFNPIAQIAETIDQDLNPYKQSASSSFQEYQYRQRPQSSKTRQNFSYQLKTATMSSNQTKRQRLLKYKVPQIPKPNKKQLSGTSDQPYFTNMSSRPTQQLTSQQLLTLNNDLESQLNINEGENLVDAIDRNYRLIARPQGLSQASIARNGDDPYAREMYIQAKYGDDNKRLAKDLRAFNNKLSNASKRPIDVSKQIAWKAQRPSTAKTKFSSQQPQVLVPTRSNFQEIEDTTLDREMEAVGIAKENNETTLRNSLGADSEAQRVSRSKSRSLKKNLKDKDKQSSKVRPRSAYVLPQKLHLASGSAAELNKNLKSITNPMDQMGRDHFGYQPRHLQTNKSQPQIAAQSRVQSAGARRISATRHDPYSQAEDLRRIRPQNRPTRFLGEASGSALMEIDEFSGANSNSDTQIIYSGNHSGGGSAHKSSIGRVSKKEMATIQEAKYALENTQNIQTGIDDQNDGFGLDKKVNILNDSFNQQSNMKIVNQRESKEAFQMNLTTGPKSWMRDTSKKSLNAPRVKQNKPMVKQNVRQPSIASSKKVLKRGKARTTGTNTAAQQKQPLQEKAEQVIDPAPVKKRPDPAEFKKDKANERIEKFYSKNQKKALAKQKESIERTIQLSQAKSKEGSESRHGSPNLSQRGKIVSPSKNTPRASFEQLQLKEEIRAPQPKAQNLPKLSSTSPVKQDSQRKISQRKSDPTTLKPESKRRVGSQKPLEKSQGKQMPQTQKPQVSSKLQTQKQRALSSQKTSSKATKQKPSPRPDQIEFQSVSNIVGKRKPVNNQEELNWQLTNPTQVDKEITKTNSNQDKQIDEHNQTNLEIPVANIQKEETVLKQPKAATLALTQQQKNTNVDQRPEPKKRETPKNNIRLQGQIQPVKRDNSKKALRENSRRDLLKRQGTYIDPDIPLQEQLDIQSLGTSGYKSGESEFDEEYYQDYQEYQRHIAQKKKEWVNQVKAEKLDAVFQKSYKVFEKLKITYDLKNKMYNPYNVIKAEKKKIQEKERMVQALKEAQLQEHKQNIKKMQQDILVQIEMQFNNPEVKKQAEKTLKENQEKTNQYDQLLVGDKVGEDDEREVFMHMVLTGQIKNLLLPIRADNYDNDLDRDRAAAFQRFKQYPRLQIDQGPYHSDKLGLCQIVFVLHRKAHVLQVLLYEADNDIENMRGKLRVNREMSLAQLGIPKPVVTSISLKDHQQTTTVEEYFEKEHRQTCFKIIQAVRSFKNKFSGDIYTDFYSFGEPSEEDYQTKKLGLKNWHAFMPNLMHKERLIESVNEKKVEQIQQKYFQSEAFLKMQSKLDTIDWQFAAEKTDIQRLQFAQGVLRKLLRKRCNIKDDKLKEKRLEMAKGFQLERSSLQKMSFPSINGRMYRIHAVIEVKISQDRKKLIIQGRDLNRKRNQNFTIEPVTLQTTNQFIEMAALNWDFFFQQISVSLSQQFKRTLVINPGMIHYDKHLQYRQSLEAFELSKRLAVIENEQGLAKELVNITERQEFVYDQSSYQTKNQWANQDTLDNNVYQKNIESQDFKALYRTEQQYSSPKQMVDISLQKESQKKYKAIRQYQTLNYGSNASKVRPHHPEKDKFTTIFDNRKQLAIRKEYFQAFHKVQRDEDMRRNQVKNHYDYAIIKIQKWWRKRNFQIAVEYTIYAANQQKVGTMAELTEEVDSKLVSIENKQRVLESEANMKKVDQIDQELRMLAYRKNWDFIKTIQRVFRIRMLIKKTKRRFLEAINAGDTVLHQCVAEFYENSKEKMPYNYMIMVNQAKQERSLPVFKITMLLNNAPHKQRQSIELVHDLNEDTMGGKFEQIFIENSPSMRFYFQHLIFERLKFRPYTEGKKQELARQEQIKVFEHLGKLKQQDLASSYARMGQSISNLPDGDYVIMPFLDSTISKAKMKEIDLKVIAVDEHGQFMGDDSEESEVQN